MAGVPADWPKGFDDLGKPESLPPLPELGGAAAGVALETTLRFLAVTGSIDESVLADYGIAGSPPPQKVIQVTDAVTIRNESFRFLEDYRGLEVIPKAGTVLAEDGDRAVKTPYDDCVLIMPTRRVRPGNTAVRLGRFLA